MATLLPNGKQQFISENGDPYANGKVYFYVPNTTVFKNTYQNSTQTILNTNPVILDAAGRAVIYGTGIYRQILADANGVQIWDQLTGSETETLYAGEATGSADVIVLTLSPPLTAYIDGDIIEWKAIAENTTTTPTINVNTLGAKTVVFPDNSALYAGAIQPGGIYQVAYTATTDRFQLLGVQAAESGTNLNLSGNLSVGGTVTLSGIITPAQITTNTDNYDPAGLSGAYELRLSTDAARNLTGLAGGSLGRRIELRNVGAQNLTLVHDATSTAANRFSLPSAANLTLLPTEAVSLEYDGTLSRWVCVSSTAPTRAASTTVAGVVEKAVQAEVNAGTADKFPSAAELKAMLFKSSPIAFAAGDDSATVAHGLGVIPEFVEAWLACTDTDAGYAVGISMQCPSFAATNWFGIQPYVVDATYIGYVVGNGGVNLPHATTGANTALNLTKWRLILKAKPY